MLSSAELRDTFLKYFEARGHKIVPSSPLVPGQDQSLLFTNAGMVQFKDVFLGLDPRSYQTAVTAQRCVRAGGKHNDLENVGYTARHHTFFEMLGNFSFGDYFKKDAIHYAWDFLTQVLGLPAEKLWVTIYVDDEESAEIWLQDIGIDPSRFSRIATSDNFWSMADTGPCGPCSEIFYDHGADVAGGPPGTPEADGDRYIEIWNLVFMQFNRDESGTMHPLPKPSVDTGLGLERLSAILQQVHNNYDIDLFQTLIKAAAELTNTADLSNQSLRVISDHIRSCAFLIVDGVLPSNEGRGYVLRRIIRRAARHGHQLGCQKPFFYRLVTTLDRLMGAAYPELHQAVDHVTRVLQKEEQRFAETLEQGMCILESSIAEMQGTRIDGETIFKLYDTFGFPVDLTADVARERGLLIDQVGFDAAMARQKARARAASQFGVTTNRLKLDADITSRFLGYQQSSATAQVVMIVQNGAVVPVLDNPQEAIVILDQTPFYAEAGGQVGDTGVLTGDGFKFEVGDTQKQNAAYCHIGCLVSGQLSCGDRVGAQIDTARRQKIMLNHSATHLMHAVLRQILGQHVQQKGSLVDAEKLRFDFSHYQPVTVAEIVEVETMVNDQIRLNLETSVEVMAVDAARDTGAIALFGEKYGERVRVLQIGSDSIELCSGTHVQRVGEIGLFKVTLETGVASGIRRIEAVTGQTAVQRVIDDEQTLDQGARLLKTSRGDLMARMEQLITTNRQLEKQLAALKSTAANLASQHVASQAEDVNGIKVLAAYLEDSDLKSLREALERLQNQLGEAVIVLASKVEGKALIIAGVTKAQTQKVDASDLVNRVAEHCGGRGGGKPDRAQAGGNQPENLGKALALVVPWVKQQL